MDFSSLDPQIINNIIMMARPKYKYHTELIRLFEDFDDPLDAIRLRRFFQKEFLQIRTRPRY
mgnify:FL=1